MLAKDLDGVLLVMDPSHPEQERELEQFYMNFAQPNSLTVKQCLIVALQVMKEGTFGLGGWQGLSGKLNKLNSGYVALNPASVSTGIQDAYVLLDKLLMGCLAHKKDQMERQMLEGGEEANGQGGNDWGRS
jgi:Rab-like protein 5